MKKSLLALAAAAALPVVAQAQTNVTLYGIVDAGLGWASPGTGGASNFRVDPGVVSGNRFGLKGSEDLGGGLKANFQIENGFTIDTGAQSQGALFGRQAWVGLSGGLGEIRFGRQYSATFYTLANYDVGGLGYWANLGAILQTVRVNNLVELSGGAAGFTGRLQVGAGDESLVNGAKKSGRYMGLGLNYAAGPLAIGAAYDTLNDSVPSYSSNKHWNIGVSYNLGMATIYAGYDNYDPTGQSNTQKSWWLGGNVKVGAGNILVQVNQIDPAGAPKAQQLLLAYSHGLSKRTSAYASFGMVRNNASGTVSLGSASAAVAPAAAGSDPKAFTVGIRHTF